MENRGSILETDFSSLEKEQKLWLEKRKKKAQIYQSLNEYVLFLESMLGSIADGFKKWLIKSELKNLKELQKEYYVPSLLEMDQRDLTDSGVEKKSSLEKSSNSLVKRLQKDK